MSKTDKKGKKRDIVVFFITAFILIILTSSFVIQKLYDTVDSIEITPKGVQTIYEIGIGANAGGSDSAADATQKEQQ